MAKTKQARPEAQKTDWQGFDKMLGIGAHSRDSSGQTYAERAGGVLSGERNRGGGGNSSSPNTELFERAQAMLRSIGFFNGQIDGSDSNDFRDAVMQFQVDAGIEPTGRLDEDTINLLASRAR